MLLEPGWIIASDGLLWRDWCLCEGDLEVVPPVKHVGISLPPIAKDGSIPPPPLPILLLLLWPLIAATDETKHASGRKSQWHNFPSNPVLTRSSPPGANARAVTGPPCDSTPSIDDILLVEKLVTFCLFRGDHVE